jgi:filamentous hemagglutinin family protein
VTAGVTTISSEANTVTVRQGSERTAINWQNFSIGSAAQVDFQQPDAAAVVLNRVVGSGQSIIDGTLHANGQVFLLNSNGVLFGKNATIDTGGLVASTLNLSDADFMAGRTTFSGNGSKASIVNLGTITAHDAGYVALLGQRVENEGVISARLGTAVLAAGDRVSLNFNGNSLLGVTLDSGDLQALVENRQAIVADGGTIILTAKALEGVLAGVVNNTGEIRAQTVANQGGHIYLLGDPRSGSVDVGGTLDASAPHGGNGGSIETSAAHVTVAESAQVTTAAAQGLAGSWLIDPVDFTIAPSGGDETGAQLSTALASGNVTIQSSSGASGTSGNINVDDAVSWNANTLTLNAQNNININAPMTGSGTASLALLYGQGAVNANNSSTYNVNTPVVLPSGPHFSTQLGSDGPLKSFTVITSLGSAGSTTGTDLQGMSGALGGNYALGADIDASATASWNAGTGFTPVGTGSGAPFSGTLEGLGHTIDGVVINGSSVAFTGLFGFLTGQVANVRVTNATVTGGTSGNEAAAGILVGESYGRVAGSYTSGTVTETNDWPTGGLVGNNSGTIDTSSSSSTVSGRGQVGGLVGENGGSISNSNASGAVTGLSHYIGGLVGLSTSSIATSYATGSVNGASYVGGLLGANEGGTVDSSHATGAITSVGQYVGGLIGFINVKYSGNTPIIGTVSNSYATGNVNGGQYVGGLVGAGYRPLISNSYSSGNVVGTNEVGGLVGNWLSAVWGGGGTLSNSFYDIDAVTVNGGHQVTAGGLFDAQYQDWITHGRALDIANYSATLTPGAGGYYQVSSVQGLENMLGFSESNAADNFRLVANLTLPAGFSFPYYAGSFDGNGHALANLSINLPNSDFGLFGYLPSSSTVIANIGLPGVSVTGLNDVGGLVGASMAATITNSYVSGRVSGGSYVGGLVGFNKAGTVSNAYSSATVTGGNYGAGGLAGANYGSISQTYASGQVNGSSYVGGLVGLQYGTVSNSFYNKSANPTLSGLSNWRGPIADVSGVVGGLTSSQLTSQSSFAGWDFAGSWFLYEGNTAPMLRSFLTPLTITAANDARTYSGSAYSGGNGTVYTASGGDGQILGTPVYGGSAQGAINAGNYDITLSGLYSDQQGYLISYVAGSLTINPLPVSISPISGASKAYDGTTAVSASLLTLTNVISGDSVALGGTGTLAGAAVGSEDLVGLSGLTLNNPNYTLVNGIPSGSVLITAAPSGGNSGGSSGTSSGSGGSTSPGSGAGTSSGSGGGTPPSTSSTDAAANVVTAALLSTQTTPPTLDITPPPAVEAPQATFTPALTAGAASFAGMFGGDTHLTLVSSPSGTEPTLAVSLSQAREILGAAGPADAAGNSEGSPAASSNSDSGSSGGDGHSANAAGNAPQDVRVPVSRNSLAQIVNGGVKLPSGVEQQLFVVKGN